MQLLSTHQHIKIIALSVVIVLVLVVAYLLRSPAFSTFVQTKILYPGQAFAVPRVGGSDSSVIAFERDGDVWTSNADGSNQKKITQHDSLVALSGANISLKTIVEREDKRFTDSPVVSGDGRYVAYLETAPETRQIIRDWEHEVLLKSPVGKKDNSLQWDFPQSHFGERINIYDLLEHKDIPIMSLFGPESATGWSFTLSNWARNKNVLPIVLSAATHTIDFVYESSPGKFILKSYDREFAPPPNPDPLEAEWSYPSGVTISPTANYATAYYQLRVLPEGCSSTVVNAQLLEFLNKRTQRFSIFHEPATCTMQNLGWVGDDHFDILSTIPSGKNFLYRYSAISPELAPLELMTDPDSLSFASTSPDGVWVAYLKKNSDKNSEFDVRNLQTKQTINVLSALSSSGKNPNYDKVFTAHWDRNSRYAYIKVTRKNTEINDVIRFDISSGSAIVILQDVDSFSVN